MRGRAEVVARLTAREREGLAISVVTLAELYEGIESTTDPDAARPVLLDFLKVFDLVIAATAIQHGLTLLTEDHHFERIPSLVIQLLYATGP